MSLNEPTADLTGEGLVFGRRNRGTDGEGRTLGGEDVDDTGDHEGKVSETVRVTDIPDGTPSGLRTFRIQVRRVKGEKDLLVQNEVKGQRETVVVTSLTTDVDPTSRTSLIPLAVVDLGLFVGRRGDRPNKSL